MTTAEQAITADLACPRFRAGVHRGHWRQVSYAFPMLVIAITGCEPEGQQREYHFRFELTGFPGIAPEVKIWDPTTGTPLPTDRRPKGSTRAIETFKAWGSDTIYRPWERQGGNHNNWGALHPSLAWHPKRDLTFILEDLHGILTSNAAAHGARPAA